MPFVEAMTTSFRGDWETPPEIFNPLNEEFEFTLDPCATPRTAKCTKYFTPEQDGLRQSWAGEVVFMNPPYGRQIGRWVRKAWEESRCGALVVGLLPARTDTKWFHRYILEKAEIRFLKGRIYFRRDGGKVDRAPFPSMIVVWRPYFPKYQWEEIRKALIVKCIKDVIIPIEKLWEKFPDKRWNPPAVAFRKGEDYRVFLDRCIEENSRFQGAEVLYAEDL